METVRVWEEPQRSLIQLADHKILERHWCYAGEWQMGTHIWMPADLLDDIFVEVASIAKKIAGNVVGMLQASKYSLLEPRAISFPQISLCALCGEVDVLHPFMVGLRCVMEDMLLEDDHIGVWYFFRIY